MNKKFLFFLFNLSNFSLFCLEEEPVKQCITCVCDTDLSDEKEENNINGPFCNYGINETFGGVLKEEEVELYCKQECEKENQELKTQFIWNQKN